ncbi:Aldehyde dehydrogenase, conserved site [Pleurostoma richardsiae]|uniref:Aldehyde dehydrogenase, conserved site n=1 Tax=Pleurostoma richardsiae TaxID=41990 RepID=A0AA38S0Q1_9PEZI|nr:Aldehyde dehydrogenase, conserved site [Pleurostoma richardsiae]
MASKPTYLLVPNFTFKPENGPIALGNIIADPTRPHRVLSPLQVASLSRYPRVERFTEYDSRMARDSSRDMSLALWTQFLQGVTAKISGARGGSAVSEYTMDALETIYFISDPSHEEIVARVKEPRVQAAIRSGLGRRSPVYMVSGLKIAKGFSAMKGKRQYSSQAAEAGGAVPSPVGDISVGGSVSRIKDFSESQEWRAGEDIVLAYQLLKIEMKGSKDEGVVYDEFRHKAAYLSTDDSDENEDDNHLEEADEVHISAMTETDYAGFGGVLSSISEPHNWKLFALSTSQ